MIMQNLSLIALSSLMKSDNVLKVFIIHCIYNVIYSFYIKNMKGASLKASY